MGASSRERARDLRERVRDGPVHDDEPVEIVPCAPGWLLLLEAERVRLERAIGPWICGGVHHVGGTSVPGLDAKTGVEILVGVDRLAGSRASRIARGHGPRPLPPRCVSVGICP